MDDSRMVTTGHTELNDELDGLKQTVVTLARALHVKDARLKPTLEAVVSVAAETTGFVAGLLLLEEGKLSCAAATDHVPRELDRIQDQLDDGPCLLAARQQQLVTMEDATHEARWPEFRAAACELAVLSMLCVPLQIDEGCLGTLSLYAARPRAFSADDLAVAELCATLAAVALVEARRTEQLRRALDNRDVIGQAKGILMERHKVGSDQAFRLLAQVSQQRNRRLLVVASHLIETGELLGGPPA
jgi:GAF domain-containing protein